MLCLKKTFIRKMETKKGRGDQLFAFYSCLFLYVTWVFFLTLLK